MKGINVLHKYLILLIISIAGYSSIFSQVVPEPEPGNPSGFYEDRVLLSFHIDNSNTKIYYTLDGSIPSKNSNLYSSPVELKKTTVVRAKAYNGNITPSVVVSLTYFVNVSSTLPIFSLIMDPPDLWDENTGIYVKGKNAEPAVPYFGANFWEDWEKPVSMEIFEPGSSGESYKADCGIKIYGAWSRAKDQKSFALFARNIYGTKKFEYKLFPSLDIDDFESFILRNSGNDWEYTMYRDAMIQEIVRNQDIETLAYRPAVVYLNGEYWGILNLREKISEHYLASHFNIDADSLDLLENEDDVLDGSYANYQSLLDYMNSHDISKKTNYEEVERRIDIDNFITYYTTEIYLDNGDWPGNNLKYWRPQKPGGKWRWILYDTDFGFGLYNTQNYTFNTLEFALATDGPGWPNPPWATFLLRTLLTNNEFKEKFINRFMDLANTNFQADYVIGLIDSMRYDLTSEIDNHINRWHSFDRNRWESRIEVMRTYARNRIQYLRGFYMQRFNIPSVQKLNLDVFPSNAGSIKINTAVYSNLPHSPSYFENIPITIEANPSKGYKFIGWEGMDDSSKTLHVTPTQTLSIKALFEKTVPRDSIVINEINYNSSPEYDSEDWVEIYNYSQSAIDLSGWTLKDVSDNNTFSIPQNSLVESNGYFVLCRDTTAFKNVFGNDIKVTGNFDFGLNNSGDQVRLFDQYYNTVDSILYDDTSPWATEPDGTGHTLSLINPNLDNCDPANWKASYSIGTPGKENDFLTTAVENNNIPGQYRLMQNYPNPFNSSTNVSFVLPVNTYTKLEIYNMLGELVDVVLNKYLPAGNYSVEINFNDRPSGVYFYRLVTDKKVFSRKMIQMK